MKKRLLFGAFIFLFSTSIFAQNVVWYFGAANAGATSYGLDFTTGSPVQRNFESVIDYYESVTVVSNNSGTVLYYSDGIEVYDASNNIMAGAPAKLQGTQDGPSGTSVQGAYSLLKPGSQTEYYLFTSQGIDGLASGFRVNRIDMTRPGNGTVANPLGEMMSSDSVLRATGTEMMTAYGNCGTDTVWVISHAPNSWDFVKVLVTSEGIRSVTTQTLPTPRAFGAGFLSGPGRGSMDINDEGTMLVMTGQNPIGTHLLDFNKHTGVLSNHRELLAPNGFPYDGYGCEFSPDGSKIYFTNNLIPGIWQYDINTGISADVPNSAITHGEVITGIDGKLYVGKVSQSFQMTVGVIDNPDAVAASCNYDKDAIAFPSTVNSNISYAMPQGFYCSLNPCAIDAVGDQCDSTSAFQLTAEPSGGTWGGGAYITAGGMFNPSDAGVGSHWVTYDAGCDEPDSLLITVNSCCPNIDPNLGPDASICDDLTQLLDAGAGMTTYRWYENGTLLVPQTGSTLTADSGTYVVEVVDGDGCTGSDTIELGNFQLPQPDLGPDDSFCSGKDITLDAGSGYASYSWSSGGGSGQTATYNAANTYTVTVVDGNGCEGSDDIVITIDDLPTPTISGPSIVCENSSVDLTATIGGSSSLNWTGFGNSNPLNVTSAGTYTVVETDANGCVDSVSQLVTLENAPSVEIGGPYSICDGQQTETLDATTGVGTDTYLWSDNSTDPTLEVSSAGEYSVIVTSATGCKAYDTADVSIFTPPTVSLGNDTFFCAGASVTLDAGAGFTTYDWSSGGSSQTENINGVGTISVTVTDANGCTGTDEVEISENELPTVDLGGDLGVCGGDSVVLDATHPDAASYLWTPNNENTATINVPSDDETYGVTITDVDGCTFTTTKNITQDAPPSVEIGGPYTVCHSQETQTLDASTGASGETYLWSTGETSSSIEFGDSSMVWVRVTTALGCEAYDTAYVDTFSLPTVSLGNDTFFCAGATVTLDAGAGFASYDWSSGGSSQTESISGAATVTVTVTDANGCTATDDNEIFENALPEVDLGGDLGVCGGDSILIDATHPDAASYLWTPNNENTATIKVPSDDETYGVTITDVDGCTFTTTKTISNDAPPSVEIGGPYKVCHSQETQTLDASTGAVGETYLWSTGETSSSIEFGDSSMVWVRVTTALGCEAYDTAYVDTFSLPTVSLGNDTFFCAGASVTLDAGAGFVSYDWSSGGSLQTESISGAVTVTVTVTDANGCTATDDNEITENALPEVDLGAAIAVCEYDSIVLDATHPDAASYLWTPNNENTATIKVPSDDETYSVTITDVDGCEFTATREISSENPPSVNIGGDDIICDDLTKTLDAGSAPGATYEWYLDGNLLSSETGQTLDADSGIYVVFVTSSTGCEGRDTAYIDNHQLPEVGLNDGYEFCAGDSVELVASAGLVDYSWTNGESSQNIWVKSGGTYSVNVTDGNACENSQSVEVTENALPNVNIGDQDSACVGLEIELDASVSNGVSYVWSNGHNQAEYTLVGPDTLWVEVTDDNNCVNRDTIEVKALDPLDLSSLPEENKVCAGQESENPLDAGNYQGGVYEWTLPNGNVEFGQTIVPLLNGYYKVNITDQFNCKGLDSILNTIVPLPEIDLGEDTAFCSTGKENFLVKMEVLSGGAGKIEWMEYNNHSNDSFFNATKAPIEVIGYFTDNETGCMVEDTINLDEFCEETKFEFPTVTVPGGTTNTTFKPIDLPDDQITTVMNNILWMEFEIFNRWGLKVYQCKDVLPHWDGMYENRPVSSGVYYWVLRYQDSSKKIHHDNGFMQIIQMR